MLFRRAQTGAGAKARDMAGLPVPPLAFKLVLLNGAGVALAANTNTLKYRLVLGVGDVTTSPVQCRLALVTGRRAAYQPIAAPDEMARLNIGAYMRMLGNYTAN